MELTGWWVLVPFSVGCLLTGVVQSLSSDWGLVRHYWVLSTLVINVVATAVLLMFMGSLGALADDVRRPALSDGDVLGLRDPSPIVHAALAVVVLLLATWLSVAKPRGMTRYGQRRRRHASGAATVSSHLERSA
jgi:hypothetical protein